MLTLEPMSRKSHKPRIAVLIPVHNGEQFLLETLRSVDAQNYTNFEIVVCDDGSTDSSLDLVLGFVPEAQHSITVVTHKNSRGPAAALDSCVQACADRVDLLTFFSHDDLMMPGLLESTANMFKDPQTVLVCAPTRLIDADGRKLGSSFCPPRYGPLWRLAPFILLSNNAVIAIGATMRIGAYQACSHGLEHTSCSDWEMWIQAATQGRLGFNAVSGTYYRIHATNLHHAAQEGQSQAEYLDMRSSVIDSTQFRTFIANLHPWERRLGVLLNQGLVFFGTPSNGESLLSEAIASTVLHPKSCATTGSETTNSGAELRDGVKALAIACRSVPNEVETKPNLRIDARSLAYRLRFETRSIAETARMAIRILIGVFRYRREHH